MPSSLPFPASPTSPAPAIPFAVLSTPPAANAAALAHFAARLSFEADVSDVHADLAANTPGLTVVDSRSPEAWDQGHIPGAIHLPTSKIASRAPHELPAGTTIVTYCWGPGCNGATRAALEFAKLGYPVKELIGGFEYWTREGFPYQSASGLHYPTTDPLTAPVSAPATGTACDC
jgi:rhodanese-related sulfurtransferase